MTYLTPADVRGEQPDPSDDVFRLASMIWRWRHGRDRLASMSLVDRLSALAGAAGPPLDGIRTAGSPKDELDDVLLRCLAPRPDRRAAIGELQDALGDVGSAW